MKTQISGNLTLAMGKRTERNKEGRQKKLKEKWVSMMRKEKEKEAV